MTDFVISDTHFLHQNIIKLANRPFETVEEMNEAMISNWNSVVTPSDTVYHLGDFAYGSWKLENAQEKVKEIFGRLNGRKYLIKGNHDHSETLSLGWQNIYDVKTIKYDNKKIVLCHYPMIEWDGCFHGSYHFHGHSHNVSPLQVMVEQVESFALIRTYFDENVAMDMIPKSRFEPYYKNWRNVSVENINYTPQTLEQLLKDTN
jgi:calcineurin-like phosphoesterase family protein